jgi:hypothetical protein
MGNVRYLAEAICLLEESAKSLGSPLGTVEKRLQDRPTSAGRLLRIIHGLSITNAGKRKLESCKSWAGASTTLTVAHNTHARTYVRAHKNGRMRPEVAKLESGT